MGKKEIAVGDLEQTLKKLEYSAEKVVSTRGYTNEVAKLRLLCELIKEQLKNENISHSTRTPR